VEEVHFLLKKAQTLNITSSNAQVKKNLLPFWACKTVCNKQSIASKPRHGRDMKAGRSNLQALGTSSPIVFIIWNSLIWEKRF